MGKLPVELYHQVFGFLEDDLPTLNSCALVSKTWLSMSRRYSKSFLEAMKLEYDKPHHFEALLWRGCTIIAYIHRLEIIGKSEPPSHMWFNRLLPHLDLLTEVTSLSFQNHQLYSIPQLRTVPPNITTLELTDVCFDSFRPLITSICALTQLTDLSLDSISYHYPMSAPRFTPPPYPPHLTSLRCTGTDLKSIIWWLLSYDSIPRLKSLHIDMIIREHIPKAARLLKSIGAHLETLNMSVYCFWLGPFFILGNPIDNSLEIIDLSYNTSLTSLTIRSPFDEYHSRMLMTLTSATIVRLKFSVGVYAMYDNIEERLVTFSRYLARPQFKRLKEVEILLSDHDHAARENITRVMDHLEARKLLRFTYMSCTLPWDE